MKTRYLGMIIITIAGLSMVYFASSYDFTPSTTVNPYGIRATVAYEHNLKTVSCIMPPCGSLDAYGLSYASEKPIQLVSYNICGGVYCIKQENFASYGGTGGSMTIGKIPWKVGDVIDIRLKVKPVTIAENGSIMYDKENMMFIDLGNSKIVEAWN